MIRFFGEGDKVKVTLRSAAAKWRTRNSHQAARSPHRRYLKRSPRSRWTARFEGRQMVMVLAPR